MATHTLMTAEQFDALPQEEGRRWELLDGELIEMSMATARHNLIQLRLGAAMLAWLEKDDLGAALTTTEFAFQENRFQPDVAVLLKEKWTQADQNRGLLLVIPDITVEIVSPSESARNLDRKIRTYRTCGVSEVWIIYHEAKHMYVHAASGIRELFDTDNLETPLLPGWSLPLASLFR
jgi:Uma2 family endonuclease